MPMSETFVTLFTAVVVVVVVWYLDLQLPVQSVSITPKVVSSNPVSYLRQVGGFLRVLRFPPPIKLTETI
jgi:hypothetical protein